MIKINLHEYLIFPMFVLPQEMALENTETDLQVTKNDLRLACQRIQDLQNALEDDLDSGTDVPDDR